jgi:predicted ATPase/DNA-binding SARP family transcriptional activator
MDMDQPWHIELFGWLRATRGDQVVARFRTHKAGALLAYLAYHGDRSHPREVLVELLWPESEPQAGRTGLRTELTSLRHQLEPPGIPPGAVLVADRTTIRLNPAACITDVERFKEALTAAQRASHPGERVQQLATAAELYRGALLPGFYEEWVLPERQWLAEAFLQALNELVGLLEEGNNLPAAVQWARRAVAVDPLGEESHHCLIRLLLASGQVEAAREQYEQAEHRLLQELGVGLSPEVRTLIREVTPAKDRPPAVRAGARGQRGRRPSPGPELLSASPPPGCMIDESTEPGLPLELVGAASRRNDNVPQRFTRFFGREREIAALVELLSGNHHEDRAPGLLPRLVTLTGPGGSGKTRLSLQAAQELRRRFPGGVWFVSLRELGDPALIPDQILLALRLPRSAQREALDQAAAFLSRAPSLLLLDNFEHLVDRGVEAVQSLLEQVEHLVVLVTSRQRLGLEGEREFPVAPLPVPGVQAFGRSGIQEELPERLNARTPERLILCPSVALFVDRAQAVRPDFQVTAHNATAVAALCQRLEGLPLALELAAARAGVLTPQQMLARLEQRFELLVGRQRATDLRHRSLRATLDWSYQLLPPELQRFFAQLSIFRGGWTVAAAEAICEEPRALECLEQLRECSLVQVAETGGGTAERSEVVMRFHLLETLREYGAEQLIRAEQEALARRHAGFFLTLAEAAEPELTRADQVLWLDRLDQELDNLRSALSWSVESHEVELGLRLGSALERFWQPRGHVKEGRTQLVRLLAEPGTAAPTAVRARALSTAGLLTSLQGNIETARALLEESLAIWRRLEDRAGITTVLQHLGWFECDRWNWTTALCLAEESLAISRELDEPRGLAEALALAATARDEHGDPSARALLEESIAICRALGDRIGALRGLATLAHWAVCAGDLDTARRLHEEVLAAATELGDKPRVGWALFGLGQTAQVQEDYPTACAFFERSLPLWHELGDTHGLMKTRFYLGHSLMRQGDAAAAYERFAEILTIAREAKWLGAVAEALGLMGAAAGDMGRLEETAARCSESLATRSAEVPGHHLAIEWDFIGLARVALEHGKPARAVRLLGAAEALLGPVPPARRRELDSAAAATRAQMEAAEFEAAWAEGWAMPLDQAIALALQEVTAV